MEKIKKFFGNIWNWISRNWFGIAVGLSVFCYMTLKNQALQIEKQGETERLQCASMCFPQQSEYITKLQARSCWCYVDSTTLKKIEE